MSKELNVEEIERLKETAWELLSPNGTMWIVDSAFRLHAYGLEAANEILKERNCRPFVLNQVIGALKDHERDARKLREKLEAATVSLEDWRNRE